MRDLYRIVARRAICEMKERGSRFIAEAIPVETKEQAETEIDSIRRREFAATHHCFAYRLGADGGHTRHDDDGEPSGTAGLPILRQIETRDLTNTLVAVTRYFGGTKLGTGGLLRAYSAAASSALDDAGEVEREVRSLLRLTFGYDDTSAAMQAIRQHDARIEETDYSNVTKLTVSVRASRVSAFSSAFVDLLAGRGEVTG